MEISDEQRELLKQRWDENGDCRSCGWHSAYYEVQEYIEDSFLGGDFEEDGSIWIPCHCDEDSEEDCAGTHRGSNIYNFHLNETI